MLSKAHEKLIRSLKTKKGRSSSGLCLVEGRKAIETAADAVEFSFGPGDASDYASLVDAETPQEISAVARIPEWSREDITARPTIVVLDGVQDPGNIGAILRLCLGFSASLVLVGSADVTSPKVIRSSAGALFHVPWSRAVREDAPELIESFGRPVYRLERARGSAPVEELRKSLSAVLVAGSEGAGIRLEIQGASVRIDHAEALESLNVGHALAIALHERARP